MVALANGILLSDIDARLAVLQLGCDLRRALAHLEFWVRSSRPRCSGCSHPVRAIPEGKCVEIRSNDGLFAFLTQFQSDIHPSSAPKPTSECSTRPGDIFPECAPQSLSSLQLTIGYKHSSDALLLSRVLDSVTTPFGSAAGESSRLDLSRMSVSLRHFAASSDLVSRGLLSTDDLLQLMERPSNICSKLSSQEAGALPDAADAKTSTVDESHPQSGITTDRGDQNTKVARAADEHRLLVDMRALLDQSELERTHIDELRAAERDLCARLSGGATLCSWLTQSRSRRLDYFPYVRALLAAERRANAVVPPSADSPSAFASPAESPEVISLIDSPLKATTRLTRFSRYTYSYTVLVFGYKFQLQFTST